MSAQDVFRDLYNLEINLIESRHMTGRKMDSPSVGMAQTANKFASFLTHERFEPWLNADCRPHLDDDSPILDDSIVSFWDLMHAVIAESDTAYTGETFARVAATAEYLLEHGDFDGHEEQRGVVIRISGVSKQLLFVARKWNGAPFLRESAQPANLTDSDRLQIRKAWEIGTNIVVLQTVAQLDGDIVTRISPSRVSAEQTVLYDLHRELIGTALNHWRVLFQTVAEIGSKTFSSFFKP